MNHRASGAAKAGGGGRGGDGPGTEDVTAGTGLQVLFSSFG